jgi:formylglycine-generating enzyme required for sulfatase activity/serine/threonine protein kinase
MSPNRNDGIVIKPRPVKNLRRRAGDPLKKILTFAAGSALWRPFSLWWWGFALDSDSQWEIDLMDAAPACHPTERTLSSYGLGRLDDASAEAVNKHLASCSVCRRRVAELSSDSFLDRLRDARGGAESVAPIVSSLAGLSILAGNASSPAPPPVSTLPPALANHPDYEVLRELGRGGMGVVYLAQNRLMGRPEVLKVVGLHLIERPGVLDRFLREIQSGAKLHHRNIVTAYSALRLGESLVLAMEYVEGLDLAKLVDTKGPLPVAYACNFIYQAGLGLGHAHEHGMVHRDIKPANLILAREGKKGVVKVLDFGLAKVTSEGQSDRALTREGQMLGTPDFIAPEQIRDAQSADIRADIYSLGCTLYYLLTGRPPFAGENLWDLYQAHFSMEATPLNLARPDVPVELAALVDKMMAKDPARRFQDPKDVAQALKPFFKAGSVGPSEGKAEVPQARGPVPSRETQSASPLPSQLVMDPGGAPAPGASKAGEPTQPGRLWETLIELRDTEALSTARGEPHRRRARTWWAAPGVVLLGFLIACAAGVLRVKTAPGDLVFENLPEQAVVTVDGKVTSVEWPGGKERAKVTVAAGDHRVKVERNGVEVYGEKVKIAAGKQQWITIRLELATRSRPGENRGDASPEKPGAGSATPPPPLEEDRLYRLINVGSGKALAAKDPTAPRSNLLTESDVASLKSQLWSVRRSGKSHYYQIINFDTKQLINVPWNRPTDGLALQLYPNQGGVQNELWIFDWNGGAFRILSWHGFALAVRTDGGGDGAVIQATPRGLSTERWRLVAVSDGPLGSARRPSGGAPGSFEPYFDGRSLTGWRAEGPPECRWTVEDGVLTGRNMSDGTGNVGLLVSNHADFANFHLRAEVLPVEGTRPSDISFRLAPGGASRKGWDGLGVLINTLPGDHGGVLANTGSILSTQGMDAPRLLTPADRTPLRANQAFWLEVIAEGSRIRTFCNGIPVAEYMNADSSRAAGLIRLVCPPKCTVRFRTIEVQELPSPESPASPPPADVRRLWKGNHSSFESTADRKWREVSNANKSEVHYFDEITRTARYVDLVDRGRENGLWIRLQDGGSLIFSAAHDFDWHVWQWGDWDRSPPSAPARAPSNKPPQAPLTSFTNRLGMKFVLIPAGRFLMGSPEGQGEADEHPQHEVWITRPFYMGIHEVTQRQYQAVTGRNPSEYSAHGGAKHAVQGRSTDHHPVENVSWFDAVRFCNALSSQEGLTPYYVINGKDVRIPDGNGTGYRLPTEAEWEYACRAGTTTYHSFGKDAREIDQFVWTLRNSGGTTQPVGRKLPNAWGLYDMHGNVWEWCWDRYDAGYYNYKVGADPKGAGTGNESVLRGNSFNNLPAHFRSADRRGAASDEVHGWDFGFRLARNYHDRTRAVTLTAAPSGSGPVAERDRLNAAGDTKTLRDSTQATKKTSSRAATESMTNSIGMKLVPVPAGEFLMGSPEDDKSANDDEQPRHAVRITGPFYLGVTEVTRGQFRQFVAASGYQTEAERAGSGGLGWNEVAKKLEFAPRYTWQDPGFPQTDEHPVVLVSWNDAAAFAEWLSRRERKRYRLPTEAEWEYACRAGTTSRYAFGDDPEGLAALRNSSGARDGYVFTAPVGRFPPNRFGLCDMHGNVWEWCSDGYDSSYYRRSPVDDPWSATGDSPRVVRGGGWQSEQREKGRSAYRGKAKPDHRGCGLGFRLVLSPFGR